MESFALCRYQFGTFISMERHMNMMNNSKKLTTCSLLRHRDEAKFFDSVHPSETIKAANSDKLLKQWLCRSSDDLETTIMRYL